MIRVGHKQNAIGLLDCHRSLTTIFWAFYQYGTHCIQMVSKILFCNTLFVVTHRFKFFTLQK